MGEVQRLILTTNEAEALQENEKLLDVTLKSIGDAVITTDEHGWITRMNPVAEKLCGWSLEEAKGKSLETVFRIINSETGLPVSDPTKKVLEEGCIVGLANHTALLSRDGTTYQILDSAAPIKNQEGAVFGVVLVFSDVTEDYALRKKIQESEKRYRGLFVSNNDGICLHELVYQDNVPVDYRILDVNPKYEHIIGISYQEAKGSLASALYHSDPPYLDIYAKAAITGVPSSFETYFPPMERYFYISVYSPEPDHFVTVFQDITERKNTEIALKREKEFTETVLESIPGYLYVYDESGRLVQWNKKHEEMTGYSTEELSEMTLGKWFEGEDRIRVAKAAAAVFATGYGEVEADLLIKGGGKLRILSNGIRMEKEGKRYFVGVGIDISKRRKAEEKLEASEKKYRLLTENASDVISVYNLQKNKFTYVSPSIYQLRGFTSEEAMNESLLDSMTSESFQRINAIVERDLAAFIKNPEESNCHMIEIRQPCKNGKAVWVELSSRYCYNSAGEIEVVNVSRNIEERKKAEKQVLYLSYYDQLTGLYNRRFYEEELKRLDTPKNLPITLIMMDVNGLKLTNDAFGHKAGDHLLKKIAGIIKKVCNTDELAARIGGDEFVILLPKTEEASAVRIVERINATVAKGTTSHSILSVSIGFAVKHDASQNMQDIFKDAENNMYRHKLSESSSMRSQTIKLIMNSLFEKNQREMLHSKRVSEICEAIAIKMNFSQDDVNQIRLAGLMHDIGKIGISDTTLNKVEKLTKEEWNDIKRHSEIGYRILSSANEFSEIADFILEHHERWDGKGYPKGLSGKNISLQARVIAIADCYDAMMSDRPYRKALTEEVSIAEIRGNSGIQFDPEITKIFIEKVLEKEGSQ